MLKKSMWQAHFPLIGKYLQEISVPAGMIEVTHSL